MPQASQDITSNTRTKLSASYVFPSLVQSFRVKISFQKAAKIRRFSAVLNLGSLHNMKAKARTREKTFNHTDQFWSATKKNIENWYKFQHCAAMALATDFTHLTAPHFFCFQSLRQHQFLRSLNEGMQVIFVGKYRVISLVHSGIFTSFGMHVIQLYT